MSEPILERAITLIDLRTKPREGACVACRTPADGACERCGTPLDFDCRQRIMTPEGFARWELYVEAMDQPRPLVPLEIRTRTRRIWRRFVPGGDLSADDVTFLMLFPGCRS
jgi:predicted amidophosphoribosyltransferase